MKTVRLAVFAICLAASASGQEIRATLSGTVTDPSGAPVVGATISLRNTSTNFTVTSTTTTAGGYYFPQLPDGPYELSAEATGFHKYSRTGIQLAVAEKAVADIRLEIGSVAESVTVTAALTGMETNESVTGQLLNNVAVMALPLNGRNFLTSLVLAAGVVFTPQVGPNAGWNGTRQWESGPYAGAFTMHGGVNNSNAFLIDGSPMGIEGGVTWIPMEDAIEEQKVQTPTSDASMGLSGGGVTNVVMKSGTNKFHGVLSEFVRNNHFEGLQTQLRAVGTPAAQHQWNSFSALVSGPFIKNKWFFSGGYDGYRERSPWSNVISVPSILQRAGDFSQTFNGAGQQVQIYDPLTTNVVSGSYVRNPFPGNILPASRISQIATNLSPFWPVPDTAGVAFTHTNNYVMVAPGKLANDAWHIKSDYDWNQKHRTNFTMSQNWGYQKGSRSGFAGGSPANTATWPDIRVHEGAVLDHTWSVNSTTMVDARLTWDRWHEYSSHNDAALDFDGSTLGFTGPYSPYGAHFPQIAVSGMATMGTAAWTYRAQNLYSAGLDVSKALGRNTLKMGGRAIENRYPNESRGAFLGSFAFTGGYTQQNAQLTAPTSGYGFASFMLGYPSSGSANTYDSLIAYTHTYSSYIQDDFRVSDKLTLNFGLRWDIQTPPVEQLNRAVQTFDPTGASTLNGVPVEGGLVFTDNNHRTRYDTHYRDFQPRLGLAYNVLRKTVIRAGYGLSMLPNNQFGGLGGPAIDQSGYSSSTPFVATLGSGLQSYIPNLPGTGTFADPYPNGFLPPTRNSAGLLTYVGRAVSFVNPGYVVPRIHLFNLGVQRELPWASVLEVSYVGSRTRKYPVTRSLNIVPLAQQLAALGNANYFNQAVANPYYGAPQLVGTTYNNPTVTNATLMTPYPQFTTVSELGNPVGSVSYNSLESRWNKRMSHGVLVTLAYTYSKKMSALSYRTTWDTAPLRQIDSQDVPQQVSLAGFWDIPFGRGRLLGNSWGRTLDRVLGEWRYNITIDKMVGYPLAMPGIAVSNPLSPSPTNGLYFNTCTQLLSGSLFQCPSTSSPVVWRQANYNEITRYSTLWDQVRAPTRAIWNMSLFKEIPVNDRISFQLRAEAFNAFNTPQYSAPDTTLTDALFGQVTKVQYNYPRNMQFALRLIF